MRTVDVAGLSLGATHEVLRARLDAAFPRPTLIRLWETSHGNPFFALELARALQRRGGTLAPGEELPIPSDLDELLRARIDGLGAAALEVARAVAALADPTVTLVEAALGARFDRGLAETLDARILELDGERLRFTHPLLGSAVAARQTPARRRSLNARLADDRPLRRGTSSPPRARHGRARRRRRLGPRGGRANGARPWRAGDGRRACRAGAQAHARHRVRMTPVGACSTQPTCTTAPGTAPEQPRCSNRRVLRPRPATSARPSWPISPASRRARRTPSRSTARRSSEAEGDDALQATIHLSLAGLMRFSDGDRARHRARRARRPRRLACRRRCSPVPCARGPRPRALQCRARHTRRGDAGGALARAVAGRVAARRRSDRRVRPPALVVGGRRPARALSSRSS